MAAEDEITDELLESIPDVDAESAAPAAAPLVTFDPVPERDEPPVPLAAPRVDLHAVLSDVRRDVEASFAREMERVEDSFRRLLGEFEGRVEAANREIAMARAEQDRVRADFERKTEALRELKRALEGI